MNFITSLRFQDPFWCLLLIPLFLTVVFAVKKQRNSAVLFSSVQVLKTLPKTLALRVKRALPWIRLAGMALVIAALARPQYGIEEFRIRTEGIAIEMAIDRSGSMEAMDFTLNGKEVDRLEVVKDIFKNFVAGNEDLPGRPDDLIGLVSFGGFADSKCPLTLCASKFSARNSIYSQNHYGRDLNRVAINRSSNNMSAMPGNRAY